MSRKSLYMYAADPGGAAFAVDRRFAGSYLAALLVCVNGSLIAACSSAEETGDSRPNETEAAPESTPETERETASAQSIVVHWLDETQEDSIGSLRFAVNNTTAQEITVEMHVETTTPFGEAVSRPLGTETVGARGQTIVVLSTSDIPVQSAGTSVPVTVLARYEVDTAVVGGSDDITTETQTRTAFATPRHVTFAPSFREAIVRSSKTQAKINALAFRRGTEEPQHLRLYDAKTGAFVVRTHVAASSARSSRAIYSVLDLPRGALPSPVSPSDLDTEIVQ